jgi:HSP20 family protein
MPQQNDLPAGWIRPRRERGHPFKNLHREVESLFDDFGNGLFRGPGGVTMRFSISKTVEDLRIMAEMPGLTEAEADVSISGNHIGIEGPQKDEREETGGEARREHHRIARSSGFLQRLIALPSDIDPKSVAAVVRTGVPSVTVPKPSEVAAKATKITVATCLLQKAGASALRLVSDGRGTPRRNDAAADGYHRGPCTGARG